MNAETTFQSLAAALEGWFDKPLADLPKELREWIERDFPSLWFAWAAITQEERRSMAKLWDCTHDPAREDESTMLWHAVTFNGDSGNWIPNLNHYAGLPLLQADEAIPLMHGLLPETWKNRNKRIGTWKGELPSDISQSIENALRSAEREHQAGTLLALKNPPAAWLNWGRSHGLDKPILKSDSRLWEPDICMWPMFASAVDRLAKSAEVRAVTDTDQGGKKAPAVIWTLEKREQLRQEHAALVSSCHKSPTNELSKKYGVSETRIRELKAT